MALPGAFVEEYWECLPQPKTYPNQDRRQKDVEDQTEHGDRGESKSGIEAKAVTLRCPQVVVGPFPAEPFWTSVGPPLLWLTSESDFQSLEQ